MLFHLEHLIPLPLLFWKWWMFLTVADWGLAFPIWSSWVNLTWRKPYSLSCFMRFLFSIIKEYFKTVKRDPPVQMQSSGTPCLTHFSYLKSNFDRIIEVSANTGAVNARCSNQMGLPGANRIVFFVRICTPIIAGQGQALMQLAAFSSYEKSEWQ